MLSRKPSDVFDRRSAENLYLSILVDLGVTYKRTLGHESARQFFNGQQIPSCVVARVLGHECRRRLTDWEQAARSKEVRMELKR